MFQPKRHPPLVAWVFWVGLCASIVGCDKGESPAQAEETKAEVGSKANAPDASTGAATAARSKAEIRTEVAQFMTDQRKKGCEMLPLAMVAEVLEVPEGELQQRKIMGCIYSWEGGGKRAEASIMSIWVKKTPQAARVWFGNSTKTQTPQELQAEMAKVQDKVQEREELDTKTKKKVAADMVGVITGMIPDEGYQYEDVEGVGDAARVKTYDGSLTVLVGNMVFNVRAFKGDPAPAPDAKAIMSGDLKKITEASKKSEAAFMETTRDGRRELGIELAKAIVAGL